MTNSVTQFPTIAATRRGIIRSSGLLRCECGQGLRASDIELLPPGGSGDAMAICSGCHRDLLTVERR